MGLRGRPPKPREQHEIDGTLRRDRHGETGEQFRAEGVPQKPADLGAHGDWLWDFVTGELTQNRIARRIDTMALTALCEWYQQYRRCAGEMKRRAVTAKNSYRLTIQTKLCWKEVETLSAQFGLSPTARMRLRIDDRPKRQGLMTRAR